MYKKIFFRVLVEEQERITGIRGLQAFFIFVIIYSKMLHFLVLKHVIQACCLCTNLYSHFILQAMSKAPRGIVPTPQNKVVVLFWAGLFFRAWCNSRSSRDCKRTMTLQLQILREMYIINMAHRLNDSSNSFASTVSANYMVFFFFSVSPI